MMQKIHLGIDTGGTYTDAVLLDHSTRRILAKAKSVTTKGNLAVGVGKAMAEVIEQARSLLAPQDIASVSLSTTLATNAVVEGHGAPVAVVLIGFDDAMAQRTGIAASLKDAQVIRIKGGHDHNGAEREPLDELALLSEAESAAPSVAAFAVASAFAVRNSEHERRARAVLEKSTGKPVTISSELSASLDAPRRALTSALNARLIPRIAGLISSVRQAMQHHAMSCPLMIVRGDGSVASADAVALRPIETVLSGPAASVIGAKWICDRDSFVMSDIGGTTTDVAVVENGIPRVAERGAEVGGWRTMVRAIDIKTIGLGGDSEVTLTLEGAVKLSAQRALPISLLGSLHPGLQILLEADLAETTGGSQLGKFLCLPFGATKMDGKANVGEREREILEQITSQPIAYRKIAVSSTAQRAIASLRNRGLLQLAAFTPSDAAHVLDLQNNWSRDCAYLAAKITSRSRDMKEPTDERVTILCRDVHHAVVAASAKVIMQSVLPAGDGTSSLVDHVANGVRQLGLAEIIIRPHIPIVAVGGPAVVYYPEVGRRLDCEIILAEGASVANSIGAAAGTVAHRVVVSVEGDGSGLFKVFDGATARTVASGTQALTVAQELACAQAIAMAESFGARSPTVEISVTKSLMPEAVDDEGLLTASITALARAEAV